MSILTKYTLRCLRQNRVRTLVTVIGIVLSVALFTAVSEGAYSGQQYLLNVTKASIGNFHGQYRELSDSQLEALRSHPAIKQVETIDTVGFALLAPDQSDPFLMIGSMSGGLTDPERKLIDRIKGKEDMLEFGGENLEINEKSRLAPFLLSLSDEPPKIRRIGADK